MTNRILVEVDEKGVVSYDFSIDNSMTMLIALAYNTLHVRCANAILDNDKTSL